MQYCFYSRYKKKIGNTDYWKRADHTKKQWMHLLIITFTSDIPGSPILKRLRLWEGKNSLRSFDFFFFLSFDVTRVKTYSLRFLSCAKVSHDKRREVHYKELCYFSFFTAFLPRLLYFSFHITQKHQISTCSPAPQALKPSLTIDVPLSSSPIVTKEEPRTRGTKINIIARSSIMGSLVFGLAPWILNGRPPVLANVICCLRCCC